ncbi:MAG: hypothetical protein OXG55_00480 [bacterium]|nr:hypothetical protein [bacterium]MCY3953569.1 hypothetical protein [bacterium]MCY4101731.1 hypothetical protein [bacterium]
MEPAILGVLALVLTVMLYLDRSRRNDIRDLRQEMNASFAELRRESAKLREEMNTGFAELRKEIRQEIRSSAERTDSRIDQLTATVINLAESLGQMKGRTETLVATE